MNSASNVMSVNQAESNELRELSHEEKIVASGGLACYKAPKGFYNQYRFVSQSGGARFQIWKAGKYVNDRFYPDLRSFTSFCRSQGFDIFY